jgi:uncharacterized protein (DUF433 family)
VARAMMPAMAPASDLLERPTYTMRDVDVLLRLHAGTARRWIDGYSMQGKTYAPVVRVAPTGDDAVTWGEFVEARLLSEYRRGGAFMINMHRSVERLRAELGMKYPLAHARMWIQPEGHELVRRIQAEADIPNSYLFVVVRNNQLVLTHQADTFVETVEFGPTDAEDRVVERVFPRPDLKSVVFDPMRKSGLPVIAGRGIPTAVIAEQIRAGDAVESIAEAYELSRVEVEAAIRFELLQASGPEPDNDSSVAA